MSLSKENIANSIVLLCLASFVLWYCIDTYKASNSIENTILILPISVLVLCLCLYEFFTQKKIIKKKKKMIILFLYFL